MIRYRIGLIVFILNCSLKYEWVPINWIIYIRMGIVFMVREYVNGGGVQTPAAPP